MLYGVHVSTSLRRNTSKTATLIKISFFARYWAVATLQSIHYRQVIKLLPEIDSKVINFYAFNYSEILNFTRKVSLHVLKKFITRRNRSLVYALAEQSDRELERDSRKGVAFYAQTNRHRFINPSNGSAAFLSSNSYSYVREMMCFYHFMAFN